MKNCSRCGGNTLVEGIMENRNELVFTMSERKIILSDSPIAFAGENCGHIQLMTEIETITILFRKEISTFLT